MIPLGGSHGFVFSAFTLLLLAGCGSSAGDMSKERLAQMAGGQLKEVVPVSGKVVIDGEPRAEVILQLFPADGGKQITETRTGGDGAYCWSTHLTCDGIEAGTYKVAFEHFPKPKRNDQNEKKDDLFKGKYSNPKKSEFTLTVEKGKPQKDVNYELKMK